MPTNIGGAQNFFDLEKELTKVVDFTLHFVQPGSQKLMLLPHCKK